MPAIANFIAFQLGWFGCVLGAAHGWPWTGAGLALALAGWHLLRLPRPAQEARLLAIVALIGAGIDSLLASLGWIRYAGGIVHPNLAPPWIVALWVLFATTLNGSLSRLKRAPVLAAALGAAGGPLSYWAGERLGALDLQEPRWALAALALGWAALIPLLLRLACRYDGTASRAEGALAEARHG